MDARKKRNKFNVDEELDSPFDSTHLKRSFKYIKRYGKQLIFALFLSVVSTLLSLITPQFTGMAVDNLIPNGNIKGLWLMAGAFVVIVAAIILINRWRILITNRVGQTIISEIRHDLFEHLQKLPFDYYDSRPHGKILTRVVNYVNAVADFLSNGVVNIILETFSLLAIIVFMFITSPKLTLLTLATMPLFVGFMFLIKSPQRRARQKLSNKNSNINAYLHESINGMKVTQSFDREAMNYEIYGGLAQDVRNAWMRAVMLGGTIWPVISLLSNTVKLGIYYSAAANIFADISLGTILTFIGYVFRFWMPIQMLGNLYNNLINTTAYLERIFQVLDEPVSIDDHEGAYALPQISGRVEFRDVTFAYEAGNNVLEHLNLVAEPGESIALVGPTGAGKSTVISLLARFYDIQEGSITIDGHSIYDVTISSLRSQMGMMLQDTFLFTGTIMDNIRYGRLDATDEEVYAAAKAVHADDFIRQMPDGYQTEVRERGSSLSAGQRQLISFARTLLADPRILILDEATSAIDTKTELLVQQGLNALLKGRTSFIIAHRLSTIKNCRILYVADKQIVENGTHDELIAQKGRYYELYTSQMD
ncbi:MAG: ABC transporter ATP-binding protein [Ruminococcaceae bacterium]|nr:ABC transporter ATP-binding protein [Oscillospiraceae bacterium]